MSGAEQVRGVSGAEGQRGLLVEGLVGHREGLCFSRREMEGQPGRVLSKRALLVLTSRLRADYGEGCVWGVVKHKSLLGAATITQQKQHMVAVKGVTRGGIWAAQIPGRWNRRDSLRKLLLT